VTPAEALPVARAGLQWLKFFRAGIIATAPDAATREKYVSAADTLIQLAEKQLATLEKLAVSPTDIPTGSQ
jgi:hypothetical protein